MNANLLSFEHAAFGYTRSKPIFTDLNYQLRRGTLTVILGPNGIGKTTLLYLALGWLQPSVGQVLLENRPLQDYSRAEIGRRVSLVPKLKAQPTSIPLWGKVFSGGGRTLRRLARRGKKTNKPRARRLPGLAFRNWLALM